MASYSKALLPSYDVDFTDMSRISQMDNVKNRFNVSPVSVQPKKVAESLSLEGKSAEFLLKKALDKKLIPSLPDFIIIFTELVNFKSSKLFIEVFRKEMSSFINLFFEKDKVVLVLELIQRSIEKVRASPSLKNIFVQTYSETFCTFPFLPHLKYQDVDIPSCESLIQDLEEKLRGKLPANRMHMTSRMNDFTSLDVRNIFSSKDDLVEISSLCQRLIHLDSPAAFFVQQASLRSSNKTQKRPRMDQQPKPDENDKLDQLMVKLKDLKKEKLSLTNKLQQVEIEISKVSAVIRGINSTNNQQSEIKPKTEKRDRALRDFLEEIVDVNKKVAPERKVMENYGKYLNKFSTIIGVFSFCFKYLSRRAYSQRIQIKDYKKNIRLGSKQEGLLKSRLLTLENELQQSEKQLANLQYSATDPIAAVGSLIFRLSVLKHELSKQDRLHIWSIRESVRILGLEEVLNEKRFSHLLPENIGKIKRVKKSSKKVKEKSQEVKAESTVTSTTTLVKVKEKKKEFKIDLEAKSKKNWKGWSLPKAERKSFLQIQEEEAAIRKTVVVAVAPPKKALNLTSAPALKEVLSAREREGPAPQESSNAAKTKRAEVKKRAKPVKWATSGESHSREDFFVKLSE